MRTFLERAGWGAHHPERKRVVMRVASAHDLTPMNRSLLGPALSDPYAKVYCG